MKGDSNLKSTTSTSGSKKKATPKVSFDKELFKRSVLYNVKTLYRKNLEEATPQQIFQAVALAMKDQIIDNWMETQKAYEKQDPKMVYYMSMEFLMGRALGNNMINMQAYKTVQEALKELNLDLNVVEDQEPDAASRIRLRHPLPLWYVQTGDQRRLPDRGSR